MRRRKQRGDTPSSVSNTAMIGVSLVEARADVTLSSSEFYLLAIPSLVQVVLSYLLETEDDIDQAEKLFGTPILSLFRKKLPEARTRFYQPC